MVKLTETNLVTPHFTPDEPKYSTSPEFHNLVIGKILGGGV